MLALAWRNIWRQGKRSLITLIAVAVVVSFAIFMYSMGGALTNGMYKDLTKEVGNAQLHTANYRNATDFSDSLLSNTSALRESVAQLAPDAILVGSLQVPALLAGEDRSRGLAVQGRDWPEQMKAEFISETLAEGTFIESDNLTGIMLGASLATALELGLGDDVFIYAPGTQGYGAAAYTIEGLLSFVDPNQEISTAFISLAAAQELAAPNALTSLELHYPTINTLQEDKLIDDDLAALQASLGSGLEIEKWQQLDPSLATMVSFLNPIMTIYSLFFFVLAGLLVLNTVYLSTLERIREFGVIISLGAKGRQVMTMITLESVLMCLAGAAIGLVIGLSVVVAGGNGFAFPGYAEEVIAEMGLPNVIYLSVKWWQVLLAVGFAVLTAFLAAFGPARMAANIEPAEAMRYTA